MPEPTTSTAAGTASLLKLVGVQVGAGALAAALGFLLLWPRSMKEGFARLFCTVLASSIFGPLLVVHIHSSRPQLFQSAEVVAALYGLDSALGLLFIATPLLVIAGLPAWWFLGALLRVFEKDGEGVLGALGHWIKQRLGASA